MDKEQPTLHLLHGSKTRSLEHLLKFYKIVTGREPTPEEIEAAKCQLEAFEKGS